jgi:hypothetical protein
VWYSTVHWSRGGCQARATVTGRERTSSAASSSSPSRGSRRACLPSMVTWRSGGASWLSAIRLLGADQALLTLAAAAGDGSFAPRRPPTACSQPSPLRQARLCPARPHQVRSPVPAADRPAGGSGRDDGASRGRTAGRLARSDQVAITCGRLASLVRQAAVSEQHRLGRRRVAAQALPSSGSGVGVIRLLDATARFRHSTEIWITAEH